MLHTVIFALVLSSGHSPNAFPPAFNAEVARVKKLVAKADAHLRVNPKTVTGNGSARGYICIWDSKMPKPACLHTYVLDLSAGAKASVSTGVTKFAYKRLRESGVDCAKLLVTETVAGAPKEVDHTACLMDGKWKKGMIVTDKDDQERDVTATITGIGDQYPRAPR